MNDVEQRKSFIEEVTCNESGTRDIGVLDVIRQMAASCCIFTLVIHAGANLSYSTVLIPQLNLNMTKEDVDIVLTKEDESWIASLVTISLPLGSLCVGLLIDRWGRRRIAMLTSVPIFVSWLLMGLATDATHLYMGHILAGLAAGLTTVCLIYVGVLVCWRTLAFMYSILAAVTFVLHLLLPESPHWLLGTGKEPNEAIRWLYRNPQIASSQLTQLKEGHPGSTPASFSCLRIPWLDPSVYRPTLFLCFLFVGQQLSGAYIIIFYTVDIVSKISAGYENVSLVAIGVLRFVMAVISAALAVRFGRRPLLIVSGAGMCVCGLAASLVLHICSVGSLVFLLAYVCFSAVGFLVIPWTLVGELLPVMVRGTIGGIMIALAYLCMFCLVKLFPLLLDNIEIQILIALFALNSFFATVLVFYYLPETRGKKFVEIENHFVRCTHTASK